MSAVFKADKELRRLRERAAAQVAQYPQYRGKFDDWVLCTVKRAFGDSFGAGEVTICEPREDSGVSGAAGRIAWSFKNKISTWLPLDGVRLGAARRRNDAHDRRSKPKIPSIDECVRAGTHMNRCTADGFCKVCFDRSDLDDFQLLTLDPGSGKVKPVRSRRRR